MDIVYIKLERNSKVTDKIVRLSDVGKVQAGNEKLALGLRNLVIADLNECSRRIQNNPNVSQKDKAENENEVRKGKEHYVFSVLKVIERINKKYPNVEVVNLGETEFIVEYKKSFEKSKKAEMIKVIFTCLFIFFGSAFTIIGFNNDVEVKKVFEQVYELTMNVKPNGVTVIELSYSIGLAFGIIVFYNHVGNKRFSMDPTPIQVQMRLYEKDLDECVVKQQERKGKTIDVD